MNRFKQLIHEIHRRSLWQVLAIYVGASWVVFEVVQTLTEGLGLPDWIPPFAFVLLLVGLPIVLGTAFVQEGMGSGGGRAGPTPASAPRAREAELSDTRASPSLTNLAPGTGSLDRPSTRPRAFARLLTWRNALLGGVLAFAGLGVLAAGYWILWASGVGPVGSLIAQGVLEEADRVVLADFRNATSDPLMGDLVTSTLRIDLVESPVLTLVEPLSIEQVLRRMGRDPSEPITPEVAREIAVREGFKAVIEGEVRSVGSEYVLSATIRGAQDARPLAAFRVVADGDDDVIEAIDELSQDIRERAGESLRSIRDGTPLETATTSSLEALRKYTEGIRVFLTGDEMAALALLEDAVELDPEFAMAYRQIGIVHGNNRLDPVREIEAVTRAYELRRRLSERERYVIEAYYHNLSGDREAAIQAYETVLRSHPDEPRALNNLANTIRERDGDAALELLRRAVGGPGESNHAHANLVRTLIMHQRLDEAVEAQSSFESRYPEDPQNRDTRYWLHFFRKEFAAADSAANAAAQDPGTPALWRAVAHRQLGATDLYHGRAREAADHQSDATRAASEVSATAEYLWAWGLPMMKLRLGLDEGRGMALFDDLAGLLERVQPLARPYLALATQAALARDPDRAQRYLEAWERNVPQEYRTHRDAARRVVVEGLIAWQQDDAQSGLDQVDQGGRNLWCFGCWRFVRGVIVEDAGTPDEALAAVEERATTIQAWFDGQFYPSAREWPLAFERLCHLSYEERDTTKALEYCSRFVELWAGADPELQDRVEAARQLLDVVSSGGSDHDTLPD